MGESEKYVRMVAEHYGKSALNFVGYATKGRVFTPQELSPEESAYIAHVMRLAGGKHLFQPKQCYQNSQKLIMFDFNKRLSYYEGFATSLIPVHHAWVTLNDKVVDVTIEAAKKKWPESGHGIEDYFGIVIPSKLVVRAAFSLGCYVALTDSRFAPKIFGFEKDKTKCTS